LTKQDIFCEKYFIADPLGKIEGMVRH